MQVVFTVSASVQLLGVGLCAAESPFTASVALEEVEEQRAEEDDINGQVCGPAVTLIMA